MIDYTLSVYLILHTAVGLYLFDYIAREEKRGNTKEYLYYLLTVCMLWSLMITLYAVWQVCTDTRSRVMGIIKKRYFNDQ